MFDRYTHYDLLDVIFSLEWVTKADSAYNSLSLIRPLPKEHPSYTKVRFSSLLLT